MTRRDDIFRDIIGHEGCGDGGYSDRYLTKKSVELYTIVSISPTRFISSTILGYKTLSGDYWITPSPLLLWVSDETSAMVYRTGIQNL